MLDNRFLKKVFVSWCYDILHAGHITFFQQARHLWDHLTVCFASEQVLLLAKNRKPSLPDEHKKIVLSELRCVDHVVSSSDLDPVFDFKTHIDVLKPDVLVVTEDDKNAELKRAFCQEKDIEFVILTKDFLGMPTSTTAIIHRIKNQ